MKIQLASEIYSPYLRLTFFLFSTKQNKNVVPLLIVFALINPNASVLHFFSFLTPALALTLSLSAFFDINLVSTSLFFNFFSIRHVFEALFSLPIDRVITKNNKSKTTFTLIHLSLFHSA